MVWIERHRAFHQHQAPSQSRNSFRRTNKRQHVRRERVDCDHPIGGGPEHRHIAGEVADAALGEIAQLIRRVQLQRPTHRRPHPLERPRTLVDALRQLLRVDEGERRPRVRIVWRPFHGELERPSQRRVLFR